MNERSVKENRKEELQFRIRILTIYIVTELTFEKYQYSKLRKTIMIQREVLFSFWFNSLILIELYFFCRKESTFLGSALRRVP